VRRLDANTAELKRMWLLEEYHGRGIGFELITRLFAFAGAQGYQRIVLQTEEKQARALSFYRRLGFQEIPSYNKKKGNLSMGIGLEQCPGERLGCSAD